MRCGGRRGGCAGGWRPRRPSSSGPPAAPRGRLNGGGRRPHGRVAGVQTPTTAAPPRAKQLRAAAGGRPTLWAPPRGARPTGAAAAAGAACQRPGAGEGRRLQLPPATAVPSTATAGCRRGGGRANGRETRHGRRVGPVGEAGAGRAAGLIASAVDGCGATHASPGSHSASVTRSCHVSSQRTKGTVMEGAHLQVLLIPQFCPHRPGTVVERQ